MAAENRVREIRREQEVTQTELAEELGVSRQTVFAIETQNYNPSVELALKISNFFNKPVEEIFSLEEQQNI